jgi:hypothetical protein
MVKSEYTVVTCSAFCQYRRLQRNVVLSQTVNLVDWKCIEVDVLHLPAWLNLC